jgi:hypothetical protein
MTVAMQARTFAEAWADAEQIKGWLSQATAKVLYESALKTPDDGNIVEIGCYRGRSTTLLAHSGRNVCAIDPMEVGTGAEDGYFVTRDDVDALRQVATRCENIDGNHQPPHPINDFRAVEPHLKPGAFVAFHDYGDKYGVGQAIRELESEGTLERLAVTGPLYLGRIAEKPLPTKRVFLGMPYNGKIEPETWDTALDALKSPKGLNVYAWRSNWSLLERSFNDCLEKCLNRGDCDYWLLLHSDLGLSHGFLPAMIAEIEHHDLDALHAVVPIKNSEGLTSTAVAYSDDPWDTVRRITTTELKSLPDTFDIDTIRERYDPNAKILLPNTGCLMFRIGDWLNDFPGFAGHNRMMLYGDTWKAEVVPEDWNFGYWAAANGVRVGGTKAVVTKHYGRQYFPNNDAWGHEVDPNWLDNR